MGLENSARGTSTYGRAKSLRLHFTIYLPVNGNPNISYIKETNYPNLGVDSEMLAVLHAFLEFLQIIAELILYKMSYQTKII